MTHETSDVLIVGGGIIGLSVAYELGLQKLSVTVLERSQMGQEASSAGAGILAPRSEMEEAGPLAQLLLASHKVYPDFLRRVSAQSGATVDFNVSGLLSVALTPEQEAELERKKEQQASLGLDVQPLSREEALQMESCLNPQLLSALYFPEEGYLDNRELVEAVRLACARLGLQLVPGCEVLSVTAEQGKVSGVETNLGFYAAGCVVIAAGSWSGQVSTGLPYALPVRPARGQMVAVTMPAPPLRHVVYGSQSYLVPRKDGRVLLGSTVEWVGYDKRVTLEGVQQITTAALALSPTLSSSAFLDSWAGLRPYCEGGLPVLGPAELGGLYYATGHFRNGLLLAPITAKLLCDVIVSGNISRLLEPFLPSRFAPSLSSLPSRSATETFRALGRLE
ncbi:MAG: glycine oxidase ThiO [Acidobacteria bacterium]|nr:glycine oxidase ThiO [Acidobacteriota bacterium]MCI0623510.1 glycine oxidase ThiO [Acidobacteriota bacterium]MCI0720849.1 glycine oxidase ThiO [Acidobacteriota bacterium]